MSTAKTAQRPTKTTTLVQIVDTKNKSNEKVVVPKSIANRLTSVNGAKKSDAEALKVDLAKANERRQSIQADRAERVRRHLEKVEKLAEMKRAQKPIPE